MSSSSSSSSSSSMTIITLVKFSSIVCRIDAQISIFRCLTKATNSALSSSSSSEFPLSSLQTHTHTHTTATQSLATRVPALTAHSRVQYQGVPKKRCLLRCCWTRVLDLQNSKAAEEEVFVYSTKCCRSTATNT